MYPQPDFTGAFLLAAVPTLLVYLMGGSHWVLRGQGQRAWRALALLLGLPLVIVGHFVVAVYSTRGGGLLVAAWVIAPAFLLGIFWWTLSKHPAAEPGTASRRNKAAVREVASK